MGTYQWSIPSGKQITGQTFIKDTDNNIADTMSDLVDFVNGEGNHLNQGLTYDLIDRLTPQTINAHKTFTEGITSNVIGNITGDVVGNSSTSTKLATARSINLIGDVTGTASFDGSANINITSTVTDDSHNHIIGNIDGLQTALDTKQNTLVSGSNIKTVNGLNLVGSGNVNIPTATSSTYGTVKAYVSGDTLYITL